MTHTATDSMELLDTAAVAALAGVAPGTIKGYHRRAKEGLRTMPLADRYVGRTPVWHRGTVEAWLAARGAVSLVLPVQAPPG